ncbi:hypothetical protein P7C70_g3423, partial [Phenoliferia sp. Uapishka_3]
MEMLASPSRGLDDDDEASLKNPDVQARFRSHIAAKLVKFHAAFPDRSPDGKVIPGTSKQREELSIILLGFRKLREGLKSIRRVDTFTAEVYESSVRYSILADNWSQLAACLPNLVFEIHPALFAQAPIRNASATLDSALSSLSLAPTPPNPTPPASHVLFLSLYLTYLTTHLSDFASFRSVLHTSFSIIPSPLSAPLLLSHSIYAALLTSNYLALSRLLLPIFSPSKPSSSTETWEETEDAEKEADQSLQLAIVVGALPRLREQFWEPIAKSYKNFSDLRWLANVLLFPPGEEGEKDARDFLVRKGKNLVDGQDRQLHPARANKKQGALHGSGHLINQSPSATQSAFQSTAIYREILEKALSDAMEAAARERLAAATRIKKLSHEKAAAQAKLKKTAGALAEIERINFCQMEEGRAMLASLEAKVKELEADLERVKREGEQALIHEKDKWLLAASEEKRELQQAWVDTGAAKDLASAKDREASTSRIETTEKALANAREIILGLEQAAEGLKQDVIEAVGLRLKAEAAASSTQHSFARYRRMVSDAMEGPKESPKERARRHSSTPAVDLRERLQRVMSFDALKWPEHSSSANLPPLPHSPEYHSPLLHSVSLPEAEVYPAIGAPLPDFDSLSVVSSPHPETIPETEAVSSFSSPLPKAEPNGAVAAPHPEIRTPTTASSSPTEPEEVPEATPSIPATDVAASPVSPPLPEPELVVAVSPPLPAHSTPPSSPIPKPNGHAFQTPPSSPTAPSRRTGTTSIDTPSLTRSATADHAPSVSEASIESPRPTSHYSNVGHGSPPAHAAERKAHKDGKIRGLLRRITSTPSPSRPVSHHQGKSIS